MNTKELMDIALDLAGLEEAPQDTAILNEGENIKKVLIGVDLESPELVMAKQLDFDLVVSHHPKGGSASTEFYKVMDVQIDKMVEYGVPINKAQKALAKQVKLVSLANHVGNYDKNPSVAKLLNMPYMNIHMPADMIGQKIMQNRLDEKFCNMPKATLQDVIDEINTIDEYKNALIDPVIRAGSPTSYAGKIVVLFAGGTSGGVDVYKAYFEAGVGTIICMHAADPIIKATNEQNIGNIIVAGHMPSDSLGLNKIIEAWEAKGIEVVKISGIL